MSFILIFEVLYWRSETLVQYINSLHYIFSSAHMYGNMHGNMHRMVIVVKEFAPFVCQHCASHIASESWANTPFSWEE